MVVTAVNGVRFGTQNVVFSGKKDERKDIQSIPAESSISRKLAKVPVIVLMAMTPSFVNSAEPKTMEMNNDMVEVMGVTSEFDQYNNYSGNNAIDKYLNRNSSKLIDYDTFTVNGKKYLLAYERDIISKGDNVGRIAFVPEDYKHPLMLYPSVRTLVLHSGEGGLKFIGVITRNHEEIGDKQYYKDVEYKIPTDIGKKLYQFLNSNKNKTSIDGKMTMNQDLMPAEYIEAKPLF